MLLMLYENVFYYYYFRYMICWVAAESKFIYY